MKGIGSITSTIQIGGPDSRRFCPAMTTAKPAMVRGAFSSKGPGAAAGGRGSLDSLRRRKMELTEKLQKAAEENPEKAAAIQKEIQELDKQIVDGERAEREKLQSDDKKKSKKAKKTAEKKADGVIYESAALLTLQKDVAAAAQKLKGEGGVLDGEIRLDQSRGAEVGGKLVRKEQIEERLRQMAEKLTQASAEPVDGAAPVTRPAAASRLTASAEAGGSGPAEKSDGKIGSITTVGREKHRRMYGRKGSLVGEPLGSRVDVAW